MKTLSLLLPVALTLMLSMSPMSTAYHTSDWNESPDCPDDPHPPKISYKTTSMDSFKEAGSYTAICYAGDNITWLCTAGDVFSLRLQITDPYMHNETYLNTEEVNSTTIRWNITRPDVDWYEYRCVNIVSRCRDRVLFEVKPVVSVVGAGIYEKLETDHSLTFYVPFGETYQIFCTGIEAKSLEIESDLKLETAPIIVVNETTLTYAARADQVGTLGYDCSRKYGSARFRIIVDYLPEALEFRCTLYNYVKLTCTWLSLTTSNTFDLIYEEHEDSERFCSGRTSENTIKCKWTKKIVRNKKMILDYDTSLRLVIQTCNQFYCHNQTFEMTLISITQLDPVFELRVMDNNCRGTVVAWAAPHLKGMFTCAEFVFKVEYRLLHKRWRQVDASAVKCNNCDFECMLNLNLECPEQHYKIRVYAKPKKAEDRLWSEPATTSFYTASSDDAPDPACRAALQEPDPITSDMAVREVTKLMEHTSDRKGKLRRRTRDLRSKLEVVKTLMAALE